jgi:hypothetical protein
VFVYVPPALTSDIDSQIHLPKSSQTTNHDDIIKLTVSDVPHAQWVSQLEVWAVGSAETLNACPLQAAGQLRPTTFDKALRVA